MKTPTVPKIQKRPELKKRRRPIDPVRLVSKGLFAGGLSIICLALAIGVLFALFGSTVAYPVALPFVVAGLGAIFWLTGSLWRSVERVLPRYRHSALFMLRSALIIAAVGLALGVLLLLFTWGLIVPANPVAFMAVSIPIMAASLIAIAIMWGVADEDYSYRAL